MASNTYPDTPTWLAELTARRFIDDAAAFFAGEQHPHDYSYSRITPPVTTHATSIYNPTYDPLDYYITDGSPFPLINWLRSTESDDNSMRYQIAHFPTTKYTTGIPSILNQLAPQPISAIPPRVVERLVAKHLVRKCKTGSQLPRSPLAAPPRHRDISSHSTITTDRRIQHLYHLPPLPFYPSHQFINYT